MKYGIFSRHLILEGECRTDFEKLHRSLREYFKPQGAMEEILVGQLAELIWRRRRVLAAETAT